MVAQLLKSQGEAILRFHCFCFGASFHFQVKQVGLDGEEAAKTPTRDDHNFYQVRFYAGAGLELVHELSPEKLEILVGLAGEKD